MDQLNAPISFIIVNYRSRQLLEKCLASIQQLAAEQTREIIVVNNDATPLSDLPSAGIKVSEAGSNLGFAAGANLGAKNATGEILCFLNPDTELLTPNLEKLSRFFADNASAGIVGPAIREESGGMQPWITGPELTLWSLIGNNLPARSGRPADGPTGPRPTAWISGAAMFIRRGLFERLGGFDEKFFMYFEDIDLCRRVRLSGHGVYFFPESEIRHLGGQSFTDHKVQKKYYFDSQDHYFRKNFGRLTAGAVRTLRRAIGLKN